MTARTVVHATAVVERRFAGVALGVVFAAWADPAQRAEWDLPGDDDWVLVEHAQDFRVGGREKTRFGPKDDPRFWSAGEYLDIVPNVRIVSAGVMHSGPARISTTLCTVEFLREDGGTHLVLTDQSAFLDGAEAPAERWSGWSKILDRLALFLERGGSHH
jgi:uncharacterized protein YndB with AHSA1/START domain